MNETGKVRLIPIGGGLNLSTVQFLIIVTACFSQTSPHLQVFLSCKSYLAILKRSGVLLSFRPVSFQIQL